MSSTAGRLLCLVSAFVFLPPTLATAQETTETAPVPVAPGTVCHRDEACATGELCVGAACVSPACRQDKDCGGSLACVAYQCVEPECAEARDCGGGAQCVDRRCWHTVVERIGNDRREMVLVRGGVFLMGNPEKNAISDERPAHDTEVASFWLDKTEVTAGDFDRCVKSGACATTQVRIHAEDDQCTYGDAGLVDHPMNCLTWDAAVAYCSWADKRLPTEAEWERAAGGGQDRLYPWGNTTPRCDSVCRKNKDNGCDTGMTCISGNMEGDVSVFGVLDLGGNVGEWTADFYDSSYYRQAPRLQPTGPAQGERRSVRGGDYTDMLDPLRVVSRDRLAPDLKAPVVGLRCARDL